jgi:arginine deiminase
MALGVHSEVGTLRRVLVHRPGLEHSRLTPSNAEELLFDDVLWVAQAKREHDAFCEAMRERGVEVLEIETLLSEALGDAATRSWVAEHILNERQVGIGAAERGRAWLEEAWSGNRPTPPPCCCRRCRTSCSNVTRRAGSSTA